MRTVTYLTRVDPDVRYDAQRFANEVDMYLADPHGWESKGYNFIRVGPRQKTLNTVIIQLSSTSTIAKSGCENPSLSCAVMNGTELHVNIMRWMRGSPQSGLPLDEYRQYIISHEVGHIIGHDHVKCPGAGQPAPIMMQQTLGIGSCVPNTRV
jgi:hypothetical protein